MRRMLIGCAIAAALVAGCGEPFLLSQDQLPEFKPAADRALCVVIRPSQTGMSVVGRLFVASNFDPDALAKIYVDEKLVSGLQANCVTSFDVPPGEHLIVSQVKTTSKVKYNFLAGKVYYITQGLIPIPFVGTGQVMKTMTPDEYSAKLKDNNGAFKYTRLNPAVPVENLKPDDVQDAQKDWKKWSEDPKNAEDVKKETEYPGY